MTKENGSNRNLKGDCLTSRAFNEVPAGRIEKEVKEK
jgi:hypothetical protein